MHNRVIRALNLNHKNGNKTNNNKVRIWSRKQWSSRYNPRHPYLNQPTSTKQTKRKEMRSVKKKKNQSKQGTHLRLACSQLPFSVLLIFQPYPPSAYCHLPPFLFLFYLIPCLCLLWQATTCPTVPRISSMVLQSPAWPLPSWLAAHLISHSCFHAEMEVPPPH